MAKRTATDVAEADISKPLPKSAPFEQHLEVFKRTTAISKAAALACSQLALTHFQKHGDASQIQLFHDAMPENYLRRNAFKAWLRDHAPITMEGGRFAKRKGLTPEQEAAAWNMERAMNTPFWEWAPESETFIWDIQNVYEALERTVQGFTKETDKRKPASPEEKAKLDEVVRIIHAMAKGQRVSVFVDVKSLPTPAEEKAAAATATAETSEAATKAA